MSKHTQGPWHRNIKPATKYNTIFAGQNTHVARLATQGLTPEEVEANCNLIAAAPDLLEAARRIVDTADFLSEVLLSRDDIDPAKDLFRKVRTLKSAIAKATGEA